MPPRKKKEIAQPPPTAEIINYYEHMPSEFLDVKTPNPNKYLHHMDIPFRGVCVAPSGSGKSLFVTNLIHLFSKDNGTFTSIDIICKDKDEPLYKFLQSKSDSITVKEGLHNMFQLDKYEKNTAHLLIIDDMQLEDKNSLERVCQTYIRGRKRGVSILFLAQNYFYIPKVIRNNCNYFIILKISGERELNIILKEQASGLSKDQLLHMYEYATHEKFSPLIVDIESSDKYHKFRKGFSEYLSPDEFR